MAEIAFAVGCKAFSADLNGNGTVDAADYIVWRNGLGTTYTQADYNTWRANFGRSVASAVHAGVPEPATAPFVLFTLAWLLCLSRAHHAGSPAWKPVWKPERATCEPTRPHRARLGGAMFPWRRQKTPLHADKLRGGEAID